MRLYLAGIESHMDIVERYAPPDVLMSFAYLNNRCVRYAMSEACRSYILDSGAFSFLRGRRSPDIDFDDYVGRYIDYIIDHNVRNFVELDIDNVIGLTRVEEYRRRIERTVGRQCIPVFHRSRGKQYFLRMIREYRYIAIGGFAVKAIKKEDYKYVVRLIDMAHDAGCRVHGLGFTDFYNIGDMEFDSLDSTTWTAGGRFGRMLSLRQGYPCQKDIRRGRRVCGDKLNEYNLRAIMRYCDYVEDFL